LQDARAVERFEREMKAVGKLDHPNIVRALDAREVDGKHLLVMEYVGGSNLSKLVHCLGTVPIPDACEVIRQAAQGLQYAHEQGLVHRDIKPSNLMLMSASGGRQPTDSVTHQPAHAGRSPEPTVKILDLGLALLQSWQADEADELTGSGQMMGTLDYMAPEQGTDSHQVDIRADIYSLGATLYKLLCGAAPLAGDRYDTPVKKVMALASEPVAPIRERRSDIPEELAAVLDRMLARNPDERYATPSEVATALAPWCTGSDLPRLAEEATKRSAAAKPDVTSHSTEPHLSSPGIDTTGSDLGQRGESGQVSASTPRSQAPLGNAVLGSSASARAKQSLAETGSQTAIGNQGSEALAQTAPVGRRVRWVPFAIGTCLAGLIILAVVITIRTSDGTVEIALDDGIEANSVAVAIMQGEKDIRVADAEHGWTVDLEDGRYNLDLRGTSDRFQLDKYTVTVHRGKKEIVRVTFRPNTKPAPGSRAAPSPATSSQTAPSLAIAPFDADQAKQHQEQWAKYLGVPAVQTNSIGMKLVLIPPGEFMMGSTKAETEEALKEVEERGLVGLDLHKRRLLLNHFKQRLVFERSQHKVRITKPYYLAAHEVTVAQFMAFIEASGYRTEAETDGAGGRVSDGEQWSNRGDCNWRNPGPQQADQHPVLQVTWNDAWEFCHWFSRKEGKTYRLPTEAEWEFSCRSGSSTRWCFGNEEANLGEYAWIDERQKGRRYAVMSVGKKLPNGFGLFDMHGNVWEWCQDAHASYSPDLAIDPVIPPPSAWGRVIRGGPPWWSRSAQRDGFPESYRNETIGFRVALEPNVASGTSPKPGAVSGRSQSDGSPDARAAEEVSDQPLKIRPSGPRPKTGPIKIDPEPREIKGGEPLSGVALVTKPAPLPGVQSWTVETREQRGWNRGGYDWGCINAMAYSPDGSVLATAGGDGTIRLRDPDNGQVVKLLMRHEHMIMDLAWFPDGKMLASTDVNRVGWLWDTESGESLRRFYGSRVAISPDGKIRAVAQGGADTFLFDVQSGEVLKRHKHPSDYYLAWSPDGGVLATAGAYGFVLWDPQSGQIVRTLDGRVAWSPDGSMMASRCSDGMGIWNANSGERVRVLKAGPYSDWSPDGQMLATTDGEYLRIWDVKSGTQLRETRLGPKLHLDKLASNSVHVCWSPDGKTLASSRGGLLWLWEVDSGKVRNAIHLQQSNSYSFVWSPYGELAAATGPDGTVLLGDLESGSPFVSLAGSSRRFRWSPDGKTLVTGSPIDASVQLWDAGTGQSIRVFNDERKPATGLALSHDGKTVAAATADSTKVDLWDVATGKRSFVDVGVGTSRHYWSPDSRTLAGVAGKTIHLWDPDSGYSTGKLEGCSTELSLAWSPNSKILVSVTEKYRTIQLWDVEQQQLLQTLEGYEGVLENVFAWSLDGKTLSVWQDGKIIRIWDIESCKQIASIPHRGHTNYPRFFPMALSPDGTILAVAMYGDGIALYDVHSQKLREELDLPVTNPRTSFLRWSSDGKQLISAHTNNTLRYWDVASGLQMKCNRMQGGSSRVERMALSQSGKVGATVTIDGSIYLWEAETGNAVGTVVLFPDRQHLLVSPDGHYRTTLDTEKDLVHIVQTDSGEQLTLTPAEFAEKYGWKNDPEKVRLNLGALTEPEIPESEPEP